MSKRMLRELLQDFNAAEDKLMYMLSERSVPSQDVSVQFQQYSQLYNRYMKVAEDISTRLNLWSEIEPLVRLDIERKQIEERYAHMQATVDICMQAHRDTTYSYRNPDAVAAKRRYLVETLSESKKLEQAITDPFLDRAPRSHAAYGRDMATPGLRGTEADQERRRLREDHHQTELKRLHRTDVCDTDIQPDIISEIDAVVADLERTCLEAKQRRAQIYEEQGVLLSDTLSRGKTSATERERISQIPLREEEEQKFLKQWPIHHSTPAGRPSSRSSQHSFEDNSDVDSVHSFYSLHSQRSHSPAEDYQRLPERRSANRESHHREGERGTHSVSTQVYGQQGLKGEPPRATRLSPPQRDRGAPREYSGPPSYTLPPPPKPFVVERQLERLSVPTFKGDEKEYEAWWGGFKRMVDDRTDLEMDLKFMRLGQALKGDARAVLDGLTCSAAAYVKVKNRLHRKYGGEQRQLSYRIQAIRKSRTVREDHAEDLERLSDQLEALTEVMRQGGRMSELKDSVLYLTVREKLPASILIRYNRWATEHCLEKSTETLKIFVGEEALYAMEAAEGLKAGPAVGGSGARRDKPPPFRGGSRQKEVPTSTLKSAEDPPRVSRPRRCRLCSGEHWLPECDQFHKLPMADRWARVRQMYVCFRCLGSAHRAVDCRWGRPCGVDGCTMRHHKLLHEERKPGEEATASKGAPGPPSRPRGVSGSTAGASADVTAMSQIARGRPVSLRTVPVLLSCEGRRLHINALLDDGSMHTYINQHVADYLGATGQPYDTRMIGVGGQVTEVQGSMVVLEIASQDGHEHGAIAAMTMKSVVGNTSPVNWRVAARGWPHLAQVPFPRLEDMHHVDMLIGCDAHPLMVPLKEVGGGPGSPTARLTPLGWTCVGAVHPAVRREWGGVPAERQEVPLCAVEDNRLSDVVVKYWEMEEPPPGEALKPEQRQARQIVKATCQKKDGYYQVGVPWREPLPELPDNYAAVYRRLQSTERKLLREPEVGKLYMDTIAEYVEKGYIRCLGERGEPEPGEILVAHFPVTRMDRQTTKCRVVFDAAAQYMGWALNDLILPTPVLLNGLVDVLTRFRRHPVAVGCDISAMYLQVRLLLEDRKKHRFLWRNLQTDRPPLVFEHHRAMFGNGASPYMVLEVVQENARGHEVTHPRAAEAVLKSTYMDDTLDSVKTDQEAWKLYEDLRAVWAAAGMQARKWFSSSAWLMSQIPEEDRAKNVEFDPENKMTTKTLGVSWETATDSFTFRVGNLDTWGPWTKRTFLRKIATLFDPLGLAAPVVVAARMILQDIWRSGTDWDEPVSEALQLSATAWVEALPGLEELRIPRALTPSGEGITVQLHLFSDASTTAYGAVAYLRTETESGEVQVRLCLARAKVTPLQHVSIPRLELTAAVLAVKLMKVILPIMELHRMDCYHWTDSTDVLYWIRGCGKCYKPYVANRVGVVQSETEPSRWRHVPTALNPADHVSRGLTGREMGGADLWIQGPAFLMLGPDSWPETKAGAEPEHPERRERQASFVSAQQKDTETADTLQETRLAPVRYSSWRKLARVTAYVLRFLHNCRCVGATRVLGPLSSEEIQDAQVYHIIATQRKHFGRERAAVLQGKAVPANSKLRHLKPQFDVEGQLRVDGRLEKAVALSWAARNPILLPRYSEITRLVIKDCHERMLHAGTNRVLAELTEKYWVVSSREAILSWARSCAVCRRRKTQPASQLMAPLPSYRSLKTFKAFENTSVDYAGPMYTKQGRGRAPLKRYLCVFGCLSTRAVHLEVAWSLDTNAFLNAFTRMAARRGTPRRMWSDNGSNFLGADRELRELVRGLSKERILEHSGNAGIKWSFNPPGAPHFNGVHEVLVRSAKRALNIVLKQAMVSDEELITAVTAIEDLMNSRPLTYESSDVNDIKPLTPNHFLHGRMGGYFAPDSVDEINYDVRRRWRYVQELVRTFWERWVKEWLPSLHPRSKWTRINKDFKVDDVVLLLSPDTPRGKWPLGRITEVYPGSDGHVRAVDVRVKGQVYRRPVVKLCPLELT